MSYLFHLFLQIQFEHLYRIMIQRQKLDALATFNLRGWT